VKVTSNSAIPAAAPISGARTSANTPAVVAFGRTEVVMPDGSVPLEVLLPGTELEAKVFLPNGEQDFTASEFLWSTTATNDAIVIDEDDIGKAISVTITRHDWTETIDVGIAQQPGTMPIITGAKIVVADGTEVAGSPRVGESLNVRFTFNDKIIPDGAGGLVDYVYSNDITNFPADITLHWFARANGNGAPRRLATTAGSYTILPADLSHTIEVRVVAKGDFIGTATVRTESFVRNADGTVPDTTTGIDLFAPNRTLVAQGTLKSGELATIGQARIDLRAETLTLPTGFTVRSFSVNGGQRWTRGAIRFDRNTDNGISGLLNRGLTLVVANAEPARDGTFAAGTIIIEFPVINARPRAGRVAVNYLEGSATNSWLLINNDRRSDDFRDVVKVGIEVAQVPPRGDTTPLRWGVFYGDNTSTNGGVIAPTGIHPTRGTPIAGARVTYMIREQAFSTTENGVTTFTASTRPSRVNVVGTPLPPRLVARNGVITLRAGMSATNGGNAVETMTFTQGGEVRIWTVATDRRPASAAQVIPAP
jgi:hypothetical protein